MTLSRSHDLFGVDNISFWTSIVVTGWNTTSLGPVYLSSVGGGIDVFITIFALML